MIILLCRCAVMDCCDGVGGAFIISTEKVMGNERVLLEQHLLDRFVHTNNKYRLKIYGKLWICYH